MSIHEIPYPPDFQIDFAAAHEEERRRRAREGLDPSDVLSEVQSLMLAIADDTQHPLWHLVHACTTVGTARETGKTPHTAEDVGAAFLPLIDKAITRLVTERLLGGLGHDLRQDTPPPGRRRSPPLRGPTTPPPSPWRRASGSVWPRCWRSTPRPCRRCSLSAAGASCACRPR
jgi:hypothetical protein